MTTIHPSSESQLDTLASARYASAIVNESGTENLQYCGRRFRAEEIEWIRQLIDREPRLGRTAVSMRFCDEFGWMSANGRRKEMSCRVALLRMEQDGLLVLPPRQKRNGNGRVRPAITTASDPGRPITDPVELLPPIRIEPVETRFQSRQFNELIQRYHYLGYTPLAGAQIRYLVHTGSSLIALLGFGAAAWALTPRDRFVGWSAEERKRNLHLVVCNARFLILPWIESRNLASHILGRVARRLPGDWLQRYAYRPVLMETCVQMDRFHGTCYLAANWIRVGQTTGRGRCDRTHRPVLPMKSIWVYPLERNWRRKLRDRTEGRNGR